MIEEDKLLYKKKIYKNYRLKKPCVVYDKMFEKKKNIAWMRGGDFFNVNYNITYIIWKYDPLKYLYINYRVHHKK